MSATGVCVWSFSCQILQPAHAGIGDEDQFAGISIHIFPFQAEKIGGFVEFDGKFPPECLSCFLIGYFQSDHICMDFIEVHKYSPVSVDGVLVTGTF